MVGRNRKVSQTKNRQQAIALPWLERAFSFRHQRCVDKVPPDKVQLNCALVQAKVERLLVVGSCLTYLPISSDHASVEIVLTRTKQLLLYRTNGRS